MKNCIRKLSSQKSIKITSDLSAETLKALKEWNIPQVIKVNNFQLRFLYPTKLTLKNEQRQSKAIHGHRSSIAKGSKGILYTKGTKILSVMLSEERINIVR